jgi:hypothetical protein
VRGRLLAGRPSSPEPPHYCRDGRARWRNDWRLPLDLTDRELETAARACRALAYQEEQAAKRMGNPAMRGSIENTAKRAAALGRALWWSATPRPGHGCSRLPAFFSALEGLVTWRERRARNRNEIRPGERHHFPARRQAEQDGDAERRRIR